MSNFIKTTTGTLLATQNLICLQVCNEEETYSISAQYLTEDLRNFKEIIIYYDNKEIAQKELLEFTNYFCQ